MTRVNINICKNILRFRRMHPTVDYETLALHYHKPEETGIMDTLMTLNAKDKEVLILYYIEGYSCKEIADMLKVSESAVEEKLERARKRLKKNMKVRADKIGKKLENISKLADDIVLTEQNERKLFIAYKRELNPKEEKSSYERILSCSSSCISYDDNVFCKLLPAIS
ncbi:MAG: RNA polymerase sigma factor [Streptococcus sp.]